MRHCIRFMAMFGLVAIAHSLDAQSTIATVRVKPFRLDIGATRGRVELVARWDSIPESVVLIASDAIVESSGLLAPSSFPPTVVHVSLTPASARQFVRDAHRELAMTDSVRRTSGPWGTQYRMLTTGLAYVEANRRATREPEPVSYYLGLHTCRQRGVATMMSLEQWRTAIDGIRAAADTASTQQGGDVAPSAGTPVREGNELPCSAWPFRGNPAVLRDTVDNYLGLARATTVDLTIDPTGAVMPASINRVGGDSALFVSARDALRTWRFMPGLDANRHTVSQRTRLVVVDRPPTTRTDTMNLFNQARAAGAPFVTVAIVGKPPRERTFAPDSGQSRVHALAFGDFPRVVFVHGIGGRADHWSFVAADLRATTPSIAYDLRGHGASTRSPIADYSIDAHVADLLTVFDSSTTPSAILVADGASAPIAAEFAKRYRNRVRALVLIEPVAPDSTAIHGIGALNVFRGALENRNRLDQLGLLADIRSGTADELTVLHRRIVADIRTTTPDAFVASLANTVGYDLYTAVATYGGPTYVAFPFGSSRLPIVERMPMFAWTPPTGVTTPNVRTMRIDTGRWMNVLAPGATAAWLRRIIGEVESNR